MKLFSLALFMMFYSVVSFTQGYTKEQQEVYETVQAFTKHWKEGNTDEYLKYVHDNYCGFYQGRDSVAYKSDHEKWMRGRVNKIVKAKSKPVAINVYGDVAIVHIYLSWTSEDSQGEQKDYNGKYTDILVREKGVWKFAGDHGGVQ